VTAPDSRADLHDGTDGAPPASTGTETETETATATGSRIVRLSWAGTGLFVAGSLAATIAPDTFGVPAAIVDGALFVVGCAAFLWAYAVAVGRSRTDAIGIGGLFFLSGSAPAQIRVRLLVPLAVEVAVAILSASIRPYTVVAFGILVPIFGLACCGVWGARYGRFAPR
jgi:hypothetical protein